MAYRELFVLEIREILRLWAKGRGVRHIARSTGADRKTVRRYVRASGLEQGQWAALEEGQSAVIDDELISEVVSLVKPGAPATVGPMREHLRAHAPSVEKWAKEGCKGPKLAKLVKRRTEVPVPLRTVQRFVAEDLGRGRKDGTVRIVDPDPGVLEIDFLELGEFNEIGTGETLTLHGLLCTAGHSRHQFLWPCLGTTHQDVFEGLDAAWTFFGGVFPIVQPDNMGAIVKVADPVNPQFTDDFIEYAQSRGFETDPARVGKPKDKARVERQTRYARDDYFAGENFRSLEEARLEARRWSREDAGMRTHGRKRWRPLEAFEATEKGLLLPAPTGPYDVPRWSTHRLGRDHAIVVDYALYSLPFTVPEGDLRVRSDRQTVKFYRGNHLVKTHPRKPQGGESIDPKDAPPGMAALVSRDASSLCERADQFGPHVGEYARRLGEGPQPWTRIRQVYRLLHLARRFGGAAAEEACARALEVDVVDVTRIQRMLEQGLQRRNLLSSAPPPREPSGKVLRFQRRKEEFSLGGGDAA